MTNLLIEPKNLVEMQNKDDWEAEWISNEVVAVAKWTNRGYVHWKKYHISDLPNDDVTLSDLEFLSIDIIDAISI